MLAGEIDLDELSDEEQVVANAEIDTAIEERANSAAPGHSSGRPASSPWRSTLTVALVEHRPDGTTVLLAPAAD